MQNPIASLHDNITRFGFYFGGATLVGIVICFWIEVVSRYFFNSPTLWSNALVAYFLCISVSLAMPELARTHGHIAITILSEKLPPVARVKYDRFLVMIAGIVCLITVWIVVDETLRQIGSGTTTAMGINVPKYWLSSFICYAFINTSFHFLRHAFFPAPAVDKNNT
ncbi:TRAP transporter small permease [Halomonas sp. ATCH28]|uniref:TRAP transporter small permease protein n=1 Tax=Halomonas gemina TaxID=2945105 RepID=A0ABT0T5Y5_9GAMM|nr:TRAP transporter small permease [Halomonas gemina]